LARISTYVVDGSIVDGDKVIGSDANNSMITKNYTIGDLAAYIGYSIGNNLLVPYVNASQDVNLGAFNLTANSLIVGNQLILGGTAGLAGQVLMSNGSGSPASWAYNIGSQTLRDVLNQGNTGNKNLILSNTTTSTIALDLEKLYGANVGLYVFDNLLNSSSALFPNKLDVQESSLQKTASYSASGIRYSNNGFNVDINPNTYANQTLLYPSGGGVLVTSVNGNLADLTGNVTLSGLGLGTVTSVDVTPGTGISASVANSTTTPNITITNTAPDQTVVLKNGAGIAVTGTYPEFTITNTGSSITPAALTKTDDTNVTLTLGGSPTTALLAATSLTLGWTGTLADSRIDSATNWNTAYNNRITSLTTTGNSGSSTLSSNTLNIPTYTLAGLGGIGLTALSSSATGLTYTNTTGVFSLTSGYLIPTTASYNNTNWDTAYTNRITSLTTTGTGAATLVANVLNIPTPGTAAFTSLTVTGDSGASTLSSGVLNVPTYTLSGLGGQTQLNGTGFVKASGTTITYDNTSYQPLLTNPVTGTGTTNFISKWTSSSALGDSQIFDNGTNVGIGISTSLTKKLTIDGNIWMKYSSDIKDSGLSIGSQNNYITLRPTATGSVGGNDLAIDMFYQEPLVDFGTGFNSGTFDFALQSDGKILAVGSFSTYRGDASNKIARINTDRLRDTSFSVGTGFTSGDTNTVAIQTDGKIIVGGNFLFYNTTSSIRISRLNEDGTLDTSFNSNVGSGFNFAVQAIAIQNDGKIIAIGGFALYNGTNVGKIARINTDGTLDTSFNVGGSGFVTGNGIIIKIQSDGKILVVGAFSDYNGTSVNNIVRINLDGTIDNTFNVGGSSSNGQIRNIDIQSDGKMIIVGDFTSYNGTSVGKIARINTDGTLDTSFNIGGSGLNNIAYAVAIQSDGKIIVGGGFTSYNGTSANRIAYLNSDGTLDTSFNVGGSGFNTTVFRLKIQSNGKILTGGFFTTFNSITANRIIELPNATQVGTTRFTIKRDTGNVGIGTTTPIAKLDINGTFHTTGENTLDNLAGTGTRMVVASASGVLSTQAIGGGGTVTSVAALSLGTSGSDLGSTVANGTTTPVITLNVPDASATARGVITTGAQTIAGAKTFSTAPILSSLTASQILALDGSGNIQSLAVATYPSLTELSYVKGVTSSIQTQIGTKQATITGAATTITSSDLTVSRAVISNASGKIAVSATTDTELGYVSGVTSSIQTQLNGKQATLTNPITGTGTNNEIAYFNSTGSTIASLSTTTYPTLTQLSYVKGVTSAVQTQLDSKGYTLALTSVAGNIATVTPYYFGNQGRAITQTADVSRVYIPKAGTIKKAYITLTSGTTGTITSITVNVRLNNAADTLVATSTANAVFRTFINSALAINVSEGDYIEMKVTSVLTVAPITNIFSGTLYIE